MILDEQFRKATPDSRLTWSDPPGHWQIDAEHVRLVVEPRGQTDFWQHTYDGSIAVGDVDSTTHSPVKFATTS